MMSKVEGRLYGDVEIGRASGRGRFWEQLVADWDGVKEMQVVEVGCRISIGERTASEVRLAALGDHYPGVSWLQASQDAVDAEAASGKAPPQCIRWPLLGSRMSNCNQEQPSGRLNLSRIGTLVFMSL